MRSAILGVYFADDCKRRQEFVRASSEITHRDPRAIIAALAVAEAAAWMSRQDDEIEALLETLDALSADSEWQSLTHAIRLALSLDEQVTDFARRIGADDGVSGYAYRSVPVAIFAAIRHLRDFQAAVSEVIACGGDTDTVAAITGALVGSRVCVQGIPARWYVSILDWPRSPALLLRVASTLKECRQTKTAARPVRYFWPAIPLRNAAFTAIVLLHGIRRLLPPY
jgi:ADP-ribosylglycohydrolase